MVWLPGSDALRGMCHCGATRLSEGPVEVWEWLLAHPVGHSPGPTPEPASGPPTVVPGPEQAHGPSTPSGAGVPR